jgi:hypothetical protein
LNNIIGSNVFTDANIDFVVVYDSTNQTSSYYIKCNSNSVCCALTIYVTAKNANGTYSKLRFYQDAVFALSYGDSISSAVDTELSSSVTNLTQFVISTHANTTYPFEVSSSGNVGIKNVNPAFSLDVSGTSNIGLTNGGVGLYLNSYSSTAGPYLSLKHNGTSGREWLIGSTGTSTGANVGKLEFYDATSGGWRLQIGTAGGLQIKQPQYRDATMSFANTFTKSGIKIAGDLDEADAICMGIWGDTAGNNGSGYIQKMIDTPGAPQAKDLLLNPLGGNVGIGKTTAATALDVSGSISVSGVVNMTYTTAPTFGTNSLGYLISNTLSALTISSVLTTHSTINLTIGVYIITFNIGNGSWTGTIYIEASIYDAAGTDIYKSAATGLGGSSFAACVGTLIYNATGSTSVTLRTKLTTGTNSMTAAKGVFQAIRIA